MTNKTMAKPIFIKNRVRRSDEFQFFMHQFVEECRRQGFRSKPDLLPSYRFFVRSALRRIMLATKTFAQKCHIHAAQRKQALIVTSNGSTLADNIFPYYCHYEIVPMIWDVWPSTWPRLKHDLRFFGIRTVFCTVRSVAAMLEHDCGVKAFWIPEGIDTSIYSEGKPLQQREFDIFEMGRKLERFHNILQSLANDHKLTLTCGKTNPDGTLSAKKIAFTNEEIIANLANHRILICFPQCDTNPQRAGDVETLTQRYWEGMLSRCVLVGRAPQELVDVIGYNPVVSVDWDNAEQQILSILQDISAYQPLVDKNRATALQHGTWQSRVPLIKGHLAAEDYQI